MSIQKTTRRVAVGLVAAAAATFAVNANAGGHGIDLEGKTVEWIIPFSETGGSAKWANFYAPLLSEALPGEPTVVVKFMPGAGSTKGANFFQNQSYDDGTLIFGSSGSTQFPFLLGDPRVKYDYADWNVVLASGTGGVAYLPPDLAAKMDGMDATPLQGEDFIYGNQGATRLDLVPTLAWEMLGLNVESVMGIKGRGDGRLMFERGEANIDYQTSSSFLSGVTPLVEAGTAVPMMTWGALDADGNIVRDPTFPDIPVTYAMGGVIENHALMCGGILPGDHRASAQCYYVDIGNPTGVWIPGPAMMQPRIHGAAVVVRNRLWIVGGIEDMQDPGSEYNYGPSGKF